MLYRSILLRFYWQASFSVATLEPDHNSTRAKKHPVAASPRESIRVLTWHEHGKEVNSFGQ